MPIQMANHFDAVRVPFKYNIREKLVDTWYGIRDRRTAPTSEILTKLDEEIHQGNHTSVRYGTDFSAHQTDIALPVTASNDTRHVEKRSGGANGARPVTPLERRREHECEGINEHHRKLAVEVITLLDVQLAQIVEEGLIARGQITAANAELAQLEAGSPREGAQTKAEANVDADTLKARRQREHSAAVASARSHKEQLIQTYRKARVTAAELVTKRIKIVDRLGIIDMYTVSHFEMRTAVYVRALTRKQPDLAYRNPVQLVCPPRCGFNVDARLSHDLDDLLDPEYRNL